MDYRKAVVKDGNLIEVVNVIDDEIKYYELQEGEHLVDDLSFQGMIKPSWNGEKWIEVATQEEIDEVNYVPQEPTLEEQQQEIINALGQELTMLKIQLIMGGVI